jgi:hypothetical protein
MCPLPTAFNNCPGDCDVTPPPCPASHVIAARDCDRGLEHSGTASGARRIMWR